MRAVLVDSAAVAAVARVGDVGDPGAAVTGDNGIVVNVFAWGVEGDDGASGGGWSRANIDAVKECCGSR